MNKISIMVLGATGMLGSMLVDYFDRQSDKYIVNATGREQNLIELGSVIYPKVSWHPLILSPDSSNVAELRKMPRADWYINCISISRALIDEKSKFDRLRAILINALFPYEINQICEEFNSRSISLGNDFVYSGFEGNYLESDIHTGLDIFGKTMSLGEVPDPEVNYTIRTSLIGPEPKNCRNYLMNWLLSHPQNEVVSGKENFHWSGITTLHFAKLCEVLLTKADQMPRIYSPLHVVPNDFVTETELMHLIASSYNRRDIIINQTRLARNVIRTLSSEHPDLNLRLWKEAGYDEPPSIPEMIKELKAYEYQFGNS